MKIGENAPIKYSLLQLKAIDTCVKGLEENDEYILAALCRAGKSAMSMQILKNLPQYHKNGNVVIFNTYAASTIESIMEEVKLLFPDANIGKITCDNDCVEIDENKLNILFLSTQMTTTKENGETLIKENVFKFIEICNFLIADEAHMAQGSDIQIDVKKHFKCKKLYLSATPYTKFLSSKNTFTITQNDIWEAMTKDTSEYLGTRPYQIDVRLTCNNRNEEISDISDYERDDMELARDGFVEHLLRNVFPKPINYTKINDNLNETYKNVTTGLGIYYNNVICIVTPKTFLIKCNDQKAAVKWFKSFNKVINDCHLIQNGIPLYETELFLSSTAKSQFEDIANDPNVHFENGSEAVNKMKQFFNKQSSSKKIAFICDIGKIGHTYKSLDATVNFTHYSGNSETYSEWVQFANRAATPNKGKTIYPYYDWNTNRILTMRGKEYTNYVSNGIDKNKALLTTFGMISPKDMGSMEIESPEKLHNAFMELWSKSVNWSRLIDGLENYVVNVNVAGYTTKELQSLYNETEDNHKLDLNGEEVKKIDGLVEDIETTSNVSSSKSKKDNKAKNSIYLFKYIYGMMLLALCVMKKGDTNAKTIDYIFDWMNKPLDGCNNSFFNYFFSKKIQEKTTLATLKETFLSIILDINIVESNLNSIYLMLDYDNNLRKKIMNEMLYVKKFGEVFTPEHIVNDMLDLLPMEFYEDKTKTACDSSAGAGIFLKKFIERCMKYQKDDFKTEKERLSYILKNRVFGCEIQMKNIYMLINDLDNEENDLKNSGHIVCIDTLSGEYQNDEYKGYSKFTNSYTSNQEKFDFWKESNVVIDCIIGNPPYQQMNGCFGAGASPLYHLFVQQAKKLNPKYITMIIPARWYAGGRGLDDFRNEMLQDNHIRIIHDFLDARDCFSNVEIKGGICYFFWNRDDIGDCCIFTHKSGKIISKSERPLLENGCSTFIRYNEAITILRKIKELKEKTIDTLMSGQTPFGLNSNFENYKKEKTNDNDITLYIRGGIGYIETNQIINNNEWIDYHKILIPNCWGNGSSGSKPDIIKPIYAEPQTACTQTYMVAGIFNNKKMAINYKRYLETHFVRFLISLKKNTHHAQRGVYDFIPKQDFNEEWTDEKLYKKYGLTQEEIDYIESMIKPME